MKNNNFPLNLKTLRMSHGKSLEKLAEALEIDRTTLSNWESGATSPSQYHLMKISNYFSISLDLLTSGNLPKAFIDTLNKNSPKYQYFSATPFSGEDESLFPRLTSPMLEGLDAYRQALDIDSTSPHPHDDRFHEMMKLYFEAFNDGILAAGINLLKILSKLHMVLRAVSGEPDQFNYPYQHHMEWILSVFRALGHPIAEYYEAAALIYMCMKTDLDADAASEEGLLAMYALAEEGNDYAIAFWDEINSVDDQLPDLNA